MLVLVSNEISEVATAEKLLITSYLVHEVKMG